MRYKRKGDRLIFVCFLIFVFCKCKKEELEVKRDEEILTGLFFMGEVKKYMVFR